MTGADGAAARTLVSKAEFARRVKRSAGRVTQWIDEGKIAGDALETRDGREMVVLEVAAAQLGVTLDVAQQLAQPAPILAGDTVAPPHAAAPASASRSMAVEGDDELEQPDVVGPESASLQKRLLEAKVQAAELKAEEDKRRAMEANGQWVRTDDVRAAWARTLSEILSRIESEFPTMADRLASEFKLDPRALTLALRREFRTVRGKLAGESAAKRDALPEAADAPLPASTDSLAAA